MQFKGRNLFTPFQLISKMIDLDRQEEPRKGKFNRVSSRLIFYESAYEVVKRAQIQHE